MDKYYTISKYAQIEKVDKTTISRRLQGGKYKCLNIADKTLEKLIRINKDKEPYIIALMNLKGGCGKTTLACHIASLLSNLKKKIFIKNLTLKNIIIYYKNIRK